MEIGPFHGDVFAGRFQRVNAASASLDRTDTSAIPMKPREEDVR